MRIAPSPLIAGALSLAVIGCGGYSGSHPTGTGPFDSRGNYVESWADNPSKWNGRSVPPPGEEPDDQPQVVQQTTPPPVSTSRPRTTTVSTPKPTPKPAPKPKPPSKRYHTVRKGDTLYGLSKRYGTTVSKIQKANSLRGSVIRIGQRL
ncbi:MAG: LysM peptidoglycan-binding domain-containing protein, partial [Verrucomicrobiales bacterium]